MEPVRQSYEPRKPDSFRWFVVGGLIGLLGLSPLAAMASDPAPLPQPTPVVTLTLPGSSPDPTTPQSSPPEPTPGDPSPTAVPTIDPADPTASPSTSPTPSPTPTVKPYPEAPPRPHGLSGLRRTFGRHCGNKANDARAFFPNAWGRGKPGYVYTHWKLGRVLSNGILGSIKDAGKGQAVDYGVWGYACRAKTGGTSWSVHSWGVAIDTNTLRNPYGQTWWDGRGANGKRYGRFLPNLWMSRHFYWGLNFNDPMHFQFVTGY